MQIMNNEDAVHAAALIERIGRLIGSESHAAGLQPVHWEVLRYLSKANRFSQTAAALTAFLGLTKGTVSQTLKTLEAKGLIRKRVDTRDRRSNHLMLSAKGQRVLQRDPMAAITSAIETLPADTAAAMTQGLESTLSTLLATQGRRPFGQCQSCDYFAATHPEGTPHFCQLLAEPLTADDGDKICFEQQRAGHEP